MNAHFALRLNLLAVLFIAIFPSTALASGTGTAPLPIYVSPSGDDANDGLSVATAKLTIQAGINTAASGGTVFVEDGTYSGPGDVDIDFNGKSLTVASVNGAAKTIINCGGYSSTDGSGNHRGFYIHSGELSATISGFTVKNGYETFISSIPDSGHGGGVYNDNSGGKITLSNCTVSGNTAGAQQSSFYGGGGVSNYNIYTNDTITLTNCAVSGNTAAGSGGGVFNGNYHNYNYPSDTITLTNCTVSGNNSSGGGSGVFNLNSSGAITLTNDILS